MSQYFLTVCVLVYFALVIAIDSAYTYQRQHKRLPPWVLTLRIIFRLVVHYVGEPLSEFFETLVKIIKAPSNYINSRYRGSHRKART